MTATSQILRGIRSATTRNPQLVFDGILLTMYEQGNPASAQVADFVRSQLPRDLVLDVAIPRTPASIEAYAAGQPLVLRAPDDAAARAYEALSELLEARLQ